MVTKINLAIVAAAVSIATFAVPAIAGNTLEDTHAYLEAGRNVSRGA